MTVGPTRRVTWADADLEAPGCGGEWLEMLRHGGDFCPMPGTSVRVELHDRPGQEPLVHAIELDPDGYWYWPRTWIRHSPWHWTSPMPLSRRLWLSMVDPCYPGPCTCGRGH